MLRDERLVIIVEQKNNCSEEDCFKWMSSVIQVKMFNIIKLSEIKLKKLIKSQINT